jgi:hypothetical protein
MSFRLLIPFVLPALAVAQTGPTASISIDTELAALNAANRSAQSADDNAWMLVSSALVLMSGWAGWGLTREARI